MYQEDTIAAIATPTGEAGVAIVRVSGPEAEKILSRIFVRPDHRDGRLRSHTLYHGKIQDPQSNKTLDEVLAVVMRKPRSYTGEDVVEIHSHGGIFLVRQILGVLLALGARHAEPGEFTKRAFLNGRLDLTQAEAVLDLIHARTDKTAELALGQFQGELSRWVSELREELLDISVQVEAAIDFPEEELELLRRDQLTASINALRGKITTIAGTYEWGRLFREGARICICGRPNVGKSSLLNALLGEERVIVTPLPGTTRDVIEESLNLQGLPLVLWDTAGIHETEDLVEKIGVEYSFRHLKKSDAVIVVLDGSVPLTEEDSVCLSAVSDKPCVIAVNKSDLPQGIDLDRVKQEIGVRRLLSVSAKMGAGIADLKCILREMLLRSDHESKLVLTNVRHKAALERGEKALGAAVDSLTGLQPAEMVAVDLSEARDALEELVGKVQNDDILERIFSKFCIGK
jgi:tRNA modification GTPase